MALSRFKVGNAGKTAYTKQVGKPCKIEVVPFAERVWFRRLGGDQNKKKSLESKWFEGIWLGHSRESSEI